MSSMTIMTTDLDSRRSDYSQWFKMCSCVLPVTNAQIKDLLCLVISVYLTSESGVIKSTQLLIVESFLPGWDLCS